MQGLVRKDQMRDKLQYICGQFRVAGEVIVWRSIPAGHINETCYAAVYDGTEVKQYIVQRVNTAVFHDPISMMHNIELITKHIMEREKTQEKRRRLHFHHTAAGYNYVVLKNGKAMEPG